MKSKNKKADLLIGETAKIIMSLIVLVLLFILAYQLYTLMSAKTKTEQARENLNEIEAKIKSLEAEKSFEYLLKSPNKWYLISFEKGATESPDECKGENCLCICEESTADGCNKVGACKIFEKSVFINSATGIGGKLKIGNLWIDQIRTLSIFEYSDHINIFATLISKDNEIFYNFLESKTNFLNQGEKTFREQILAWYNSGNSPSQRINNLPGAKEALEENIKEYFKDYENKVRVYIYREGGDAMINPNIASELNIDVGGKGNFPKGENPNWPSFFIKNTDPEKKNLIVSFSYWEG